ANLAKLKLTEGEMEELTPQLSDILDYIENLKEVDTANVEPTAQVSGQTNVMREDSVIDCPVDEREAALNQAPGGLENGQIKVKRVLD
ncbi:Asp-tRNA(Asn)/Glu-tRNA(Gln) amidotransferase subunit GatC, partial [Candidatus Falkowbacteria bacterium]|nr:Asp-tRNA(Asn)/Glu-tRNA(Gln) amidotransferase subunit GatC [Candidatus Falkowbacteria bacterium]